MLTVKFKGFPTAKAIVFDEPVHRAITGNGVMGAVECTKCEAKAGLYGRVDRVLNGNVSEEIETFIKTHSCHPNIDN